MDLSSTGVSIIGGAIIVEYSMTTVKYSAQL